MTKETERFQNPCIEIEGNRIEIRMFKQDIGVKSRRVNWIKMQFKLMGYGIKSTPQNANGWLLDLLIKLFEPGKKTVRQHQHFISCRNRISTHSPRLSNQNKRTKKKLIYSKIRHSKNFSRNFVNYTNLMNRGHFN